MVAAPDGTGPADEHFGFAQCDWVVLSSTNFLRRRLRQIPWVLGLTLATGILWALHPTKIAAQDGAVSSGTASVCAGRRIRDLLVKGAKRVAKEDLLASIELRRGTPCRDEAVSQSVRRLWALGFFDDIVVTALPVRSDPERVDLLIEVQERPVVDKVVFEGRSEIGEGDLEEKVTLEPGEILSVREVQEQALRIKDLYAEEGYYLAQVSHEMEPAGEGKVVVKYIIDEGPQVTVRRIRFVGNRAVTRGELMDFMQTRETGFFSFIFSRNKFDERAFKDDAERLQVLYYDRGFLDVKLGTPLVQLAPDRHSIDLTIPIQEGPRYRISRLKVQEVNAEGTEIEPLGGRSKLRSMVDLQPGEWFSRSTVGVGLQRITRHYRDAGYAFADVKPLIRPKRDGTHRVDLAVEVKRGPLVYVERINIRGNTKTRDEVIRREFEIDEGELYSMTKLERSKARAMRTGYFERVDVSEQRGSKPDRLVINVEVAERATGTFQVGAGFSSQQSFIFNAQVQQQNLFGRGQDLALRLEVSGIRQTIQLRFTEPYLFGTEWSGTGEGYKTVRQFQDFNRDSTGGSVGVGRPLFINEFRFFARYRAEYIDIAGRTGGLFGTTGSGRGFRIFQRLPIRNLFRDGFTSSLRLSLNYDTRNDRQFPSAGVFTSLSSELADPVFGSENTFWRHRLFARFYKAIYKKFVLRLNTEWGIITSRDSDGVPVFERFFLGGIFNVRGFPVNSLGPRAGLPSRTDPNAPVSERGVVFGGNAQFFYNLELEFPILDLAPGMSVRGVVFTDGGNAWNLEDSLCGAPEPASNDVTTDPCGFRPFALRYSWGFGIRWFSPLGPLRFEWGVPIARRRFEDPIFFEFTIGNFF